MSLLDDRIRRWSKWNSNGIQFLLFFSFLEFKNNDFYFEHAFLSRPCNNNTNRRETFNFSGKTVQCKYTCYLSSRVIRRMKSKSALKMQFFPFFFAFYFSNFWGKSSIWRSFFSCIPAILHNLRTTVLWTTTIRRNLKLFENYASYIAQAERKLRTK